MIEIRNQGDMIKFYWKERNYLQWNISFSSIRNFDWKWYLKEEHLSIAIVILKQENVSCHKRVFLY